MTKRAKVIHVITRLDRGGSAVNTVLTLAGLDPDRYELVLISGPSDESDMSGAESTAVEESLRELREKGVRILILPELVRRISPLKDFSALLRLILIFRRERPDIVHTHTSKAGIVGRWAAKAAACRCIVHTPHGHVFWGYFDRVTTRLFIAAERLTGRITHRIIALTRQEKHDHLAVAIAPAEKFTVIHSGVKLDEFTQVFPDRNDIKKEIGIPGDAFVIGTVGRLTPIKGQHFLVEAAREVVAARPDSRFVIVGHGELKADLESQAKALGLEDFFVFTGWRPDVARIMSAFDLFVLPSLNEGMGKVLVEAMACGLPIVASRIGGITDLVGSDCGLLVPPSDSGALGEAILKLRSDEGMRRAFAESGRSKAARFSAGAMVKRIDRLYTDLLGGVIILRPGLSGKPGEAETGSLGMTGEV